MYQGYVTAEYYSDEYCGTVIPPECIDKALKQASRHIDTLTYNRIVGKGIDALTEFQRDIVRECVCELADFEYENDDMIKSFLSQYSINGVSMTFGESWNVHIESGVAIRRDIYAQLSQSGLCTRSLGVF